jgi:hypothetical protein
MRFLHNGLFSNQFWHRTKIGQIQIAGHLMKLEMLFGCE